MRRSSLFLTLMMAILLSFGLANAQLGNIYISSVSGDFGGGAEDTLQTGVPISWTINYANGTGDVVTGMNNGFRVYSPDGATWNPLTLTSTPPGINEFGTLLSTNFGPMNSNWFPYAAPTNSGAGALGDTLGIGAIDTKPTPIGIPIGFNAPTITVNIAAPGIPCIRWSSSLFSRIRLSGKRCLALGWTARWIRCTCMGSSGKPVWWTGLLHHLSCPKPVSGDH